MMAAHPLILALVATAFAAPAAATIRIATFTDIIAEGTDFTGEFGPPGTTLAGRTLVTSIRFDTTIGIHQTDGINYNNLTGRSDLSGSPVLSVSMTVDGRTRNIKPINDGAVFVTPFSIAFYGRFFDFSYTGVGSPTNKVDSMDATIPFGTEPLSFDFDFPLHTVLVVGGFNFYRDRYPLQDRYDAIGAISDLNGTFSLADDVPEPAIRELMLIGVGLVGIAAWRRNLPNPKP